MRKIVDRIKNSPFRQYTRKYGKYAPLLFFITGFIFDSFTLGRIDRMYDLAVLCSHMTALTITLYLYNLTDDGRWANTFLEPIEEYFPLAIQFFFGGLSSAFVIYYARSVSLSKTIVFFVMLLALLFANEFLKKRISNKYLQFSIYFFVSFTFFTFMIPVFVKEMSTKIFILSGLTSLFLTLTLITIVYYSSPSTRSEIRISRIMALVLTIYSTINLFYYFDLIPPVPLALKSGIVARNVVVEDGKYTVTYETDDWYVFWRTYNLQVSHLPGEKVFLFTSIFAPTEINKTILHRWQRYDEATSKWQVVEDIAYEISGGRDGGYRGYTYKSNVKNGLWKVQVVTEEGLVIGVKKFEIVDGGSMKYRNIVSETF